MLAARQHGLVTRTQLLQVGVDRHAIKWRVENAELFRVHRGVYAVGHPRLDQRARFLAAVLAAGPGMALADRSAATHRYLLPGQDGPVHVAGPREIDLPGVKAHKCRLLPHEAKKHHGIPTTTVPRILIDLAASSSHLLEPAVHEAQVKGLLTKKGLEYMRTRSHKRRGARSLRLLLPDELPPVRSHLERLFRRLARQAAMGDYLPNRELRLDAGAVLLVDALWPDLRIAAEIDSRTYHDTSVAFERDRYRDQLLTVAGWIPIRFPWRQIVHRPEEVLEVLRQIPSAPRGLGWK